MDILTPPLALAVAVLIAYSSTVEDDEIKEMQAYAYAHRQYDRLDTGDVRATDYPAMECASFGTVVAGWQGTVRGCTPMSDHNYSIIAKNADRMECEHERAHRMYGDWHPGFIYYTRRELMMQGRK